MWNQNADFHRRFLDKARGPLQTWLWQAPVEQRLFALFDQARARVKAEEKVKEASPVATSPVVLAIEAAAEEWVREVAAGTKNGSGTFSMYVYAKKPLGKNHPGAPGALVGTNAEVIAALARLSALGFSVDPPKEEVWSEAYWKGNRYLHNSMTRWTLEVRLTQTQMRKVRVRIASRYADLPALPLAAAPRTVPKGRGDYLIGPGREVWVQFVRGQGSGVHDSYYMRFPPGTELPPTFNPGVPNPWLQELLTAAWTVVPIPLEVQRAVVLVAPFAAVGRYYGTHVLSWSGEWLAATDGNRFHAARVPETAGEVLLPSVPVSAVARAPGLWATPGELEKPQSFPDWRMALPKETTEGPVWEFAEVKKLASILKGLKGCLHWFLGPGPQAGEMRLNEELLWKMDFVNERMPPVIGVNVAYLQDELAAYAKRKEGCTVSFAAERKGRGSSLGLILFESATQRGAIAPIRLD